MIALLSLIACDKKNKTSNPGVYVGAYRSMDKLIPYPFVLHETNDSVVLYNNKGDVVDRVLHNRIKSRDSLKFKEHHFYVGKKGEEELFVYDLLDSKRFSRFENGGISMKSRAKFCLAKPSVKINKQEIERLLKGSVWGFNVISDENSNPNKDFKIKQELFFKDNVLCRLTTYSYNEMKVVSEFQNCSWKIFSVDEAVFLSFDKKNENPQSIFQIISVEDHKIELKDFSSKEEKTLVFNKSDCGFQKIENKKSKAPLFAKCYDGYQGEYYYSNDVSYNKGNEYVLNYVSQGAPEIDDKDGYIIAHFTINCEAKVGDFGLIQMDRFYKETTFSTELIQHVFKRVSKLSDWPDSGTQSGMEWLPYKDVHSFLMFKIDNGKIVDVCP